MYKIRDENQKEHGPLIGPVIKQWITMGRANQDTPLLKTGESEWRPLASFPEFRPALGLPADSSPTGETADHATPPPRGALSGMAVSSLILGLLGLLGITALAGLILGILAQKNISRSGGSLKGSGIAIAGIILSGTMLLLSVPVLGGLFLPDLNRAQAEQNERICLRNVEQISDALRYLAQTRQNIFPRETNWCDLLLAQFPQLQSQRAFTCPSNTRSSGGYALNVNLAGRPVPDVAPDTVMIFESNLGWNASGGPSAMADSRHGVFMIVGFADGTVERVPAYQIPQLKWTP